MQTEHDLPPDCTILQAYDRIKYLIPGGRYGYEVKYDPNTQDLTHMPTQVTLTTEEDGYCVTISDPTLNVPGYKATILVPLGNMDTYYTSDLREAMLEWVTYVIKHIAKDLL